MVKVKKYQWGKIRMSEWMTQTMAHGFVQRAGRSSADLEQSTTEVAVGLKNLVGTYVEGFAGAEIVAGSRSKQEQSSDEANDEDAH